ncbi:MAG TPA: glutaredoxin domain-containing protein, partial [Spirochaetia bacterium]|nr:glutaredoxin domain-containing protein [Spirochaetia bacterium]
GTVASPPLTVYSLTYCTPCKEARAYLESRGYSFRYIEVDDMPPAESFHIKRHITPRNIKALLYPILEIGDGEMVYGYNSTDWEARIAAHPESTPKSS